MVIGAGAGGLVTAAGAAGVGARVAIIEEHLMGGDCLNVGCVPSKALVRCARAAHEVSLTPLDKVCTCLIIRMRHQQVVWSHGGLLLQRVCVCVCLCVSVSLSLSLCVCVRACAHVIISCNKYVASWLGMPSANLVHSYVSLTGPSLSQLQLSCLFRLFWQHTKFELQTLAYRRH